MYDTLPIGKETYQKLKWLNQFVNKGTRPTLMHAYVVGASLVTGDGFTLGRIDIPFELKDYCEEHKTFDIVKLTTSPYLAVLHWFKESEGDAGLIARFAKIIDDTKETVDEGVRITSVNRQFIKRIATMPGYGGVLDIYTKDPTQTIVVVSGEALSIIMPMHHGYTETKKEKSK